MILTSHTLAAIAAEPLASQDDLEAWLDARADGVTASEIPRLSPATYAQVLDDKLNGSTFTGNAHTRRGHEREAEILADLTWVLGVPVIPNSHVWASRANPRYRATPDAFTALADGTVAGVEVKSHAYGWTPPAEGIPADHFDQCQWGMHVTGLDQWVYAWEVLGEDGQPTGADPDHMMVWRDEARIAELSARADAFLAWVDAGAPVEEISDALAEAKRALLDAKRTLDTATAAEKAARAAFLAVLRRENPAAERTGWKHADEGGTVTVARPARRRSIDEEAWALREPEAFEQWQTGKALVAEAEALALTAFPKVAYATPALRVTLPKGAAK